MQPDEKEFDMKFLYVVDMTSEILIMKSVICYASQSFAKKFQLTCFNFLTSFC